MAQQFDALVIGLGGMGSAATYHLTRAGLRVAAIEQFSLTHDRGSSHGDTRLIRKAYFEETRYVPLLERSYENWRALEQEISQPLLHETGLALFVPPEGGMAREGALRAARAYSLPVEVVPPSEIPRRFPQFSLPPDYSAIWEASAGYLAVEDCVRGYAQAAERRGAKIHYNTQVTGWVRENGLYSVTTSTGDFLAPKLALCAGPWSAELLSSFDLPLQVARIPQCWFEAEAPMRDVPCFAFDLPTGFFYGFPLRQNYGVKVAEYKPVNAFIPNVAAANPNVGDIELEPIQTCIREHLPLVSSRTRRRSICYYTLTPDEHFILAQPENFPGLAIACGLSGHGFKFASFIGELLSNWLCGKQPKADVTFLSPSRFKR